MHFCRFCSSALVGSAAGLGPAWGPDVSRRRAAGPGSDRKTTATDLVASLRLMVDFRSDRMDSPEGRGIARRAWESYVGAVDKVATPAFKPLVRKYAAGSIVDLVGFWAVWHLEGGFEGLQRWG